MGCVWLVPRVFPAETMFFPLMMGGHRQPQKPYDPRIRPAMTAASSEARRGERDRRKSGCAGDFSFVWHGVCTVFSVDGF